MRESSSDIVFGFHRDLRRADVGDNQLLQQLNISSERNGRFLPLAISCAGKQKLPAIRRR
jgi:hypothetical protein